MFSNLTWINNKILGNYMREYFRQMNNITNKQETVGFKANKFNIGYWPAGGSS